MDTMQLEWTEPELLATDDVAEPLIAGGVRCHGGFAADGRYVSPRTKDRVPAIDGVAAVAPRAVRHRDPRRAARAVARGVPERRADEVPAARRRARVRRSAALTRIGTVEGFGIDDPRRVTSTTCSRTSTRASAAPRSRTSQQGLFEAHARDEAGWEDEGGHKQMWFAARDIAFERSGHRRHDTDDARAHGHRSGRRQTADARAGARRSGGAAPSSPTSICRSR